MVIGKKTNSLIFRCSVITKLPEDGKGPKLLEICLEFKDIRRKVHMSVREVSFSISGPDQGNSSPDQRVWGVLEACSILSLDEGFGGPNYRSWLVQFGSSIFGPMSAMAAECFRAF